MRLRRAIRNAIAPLTALAFVGLSFYLMPGQAEAVTTASSSCIKPYLAANKTGLQATPASWMGQIGALQPLPGHPSWDGADNAQTGAYLASADEMFVGGVAASYVHDGTSTAVHNLFAVKASTGALVTSFLPNVNGAVTGMTLSCDGTGLYIVGTFTRVNGHVRNHAAEVAVADGHLLRWNPHPDGAAYDVAVVAGHVLVGGSFHHIGGAPHAYISAVSPTTGRAGRWAHVSVSGPVNAGSVLVGRIVGSPDQSKIALLGNFLNANGTYHSRIAFLRVTTRAARLLPWATNYTKPTGYQGCNPNFGWKERDGMFSPDSQTFREAATGGYAKPGKYGTTYRSICDSVTAWDVSATALRNTRAVPTAQNFSGGDSITGLFANNNIVVAKGHERWADNPPEPGTPCTAPDGSVHYAGFDCPGATAVDRQGIGEFRASNLAATRWNPTMSRQRGMHVRFVATHGALCVLSDADEAANQPHNDIACWAWQ